MAFSSFLSAGGIGVVCDPDMASDAEGRLGGLELLERLAEAEILLYLDSTYEYIVCEPMPLVP